MRWMVQQAVLSGESVVPGDKSIGHRSLMLASLAAGTSRIQNLPHGEDVLSTAHCMSALGVEVEIGADGARVRAAGELRAPDRVLDAGNSGTTTRLLAGILAGQQFRSCLTGDASLRTRPMRRVVDPLSRMGARIGTDDGRAPLDITGTSLQAIDYTLPVASAQVKSCVLLAGLFAQGTTCVREPIPSRDHTERMLRSLGVEIERDGDVIRILGGQRPQPLSLTVPGDASSAAFLCAAAALTGGEVVVRHVGVNPTRIGFLRVLERMGARVDIEAGRLEAGEPVAHVRVAGQSLGPIRIQGDEVPLLVDEIPLVALVATQADGESVIEGAEELRYKETDRIATVAASLRAMGADIDERPDGLVIRGKTPLHGTSVRSEGDHRIAMMLAVAGCVASGVTTIEGAEAAAVSYPGFVRDFAALGARIADE